MFFHSALWYLKTLYGGGIFLGRFMLMFNKGILSWSLMPGMLCVLSVREGLRSEEKFYDVFASSRFPYSLVTVEVFSQV